MLLTQIAKVLSFGLQIDQSQKRGENVMTQKYHPKDDPTFRKPYIDINEIRKGVVDYRYVHGGFEETDTKFSFFFPINEADYEGRFFQFVAPMQGSEDASIGRTGIEDKITFAITHGAYFVETNMGIGEVWGPLADSTIIYRASAASAEYSRKIAAEIFGEHRPYGYIYGGSGGGFKSTSCFESTDGVWDGACPYIIGSPMAIPNMFTVRALAKRVLRHKLPQIAEATEAGGSGDIYANLTSEEKAILKEVTQMGFPPKVWQLYEILDDGALPVLTPAVDQMDPTYYQEFWELDGYEGANPESSANRDRIVHTAIIEEIFIPDEMTFQLPFDQEATIIKSPDDDEIRKMTGADNSWKRLSSKLGKHGRPAIRLSSVPTGDLYLYQTQVKFIDGEIADYKLPLQKIEGDWIILNEGFGMFDILDQLAKVKIGDTITLDNSDYIAIQYYHRHQQPDSEYEGFKQFLTGDGAPMYPQRNMLIGPMVAYGGAGSLQSGHFGGKMITVNALLDESALPWQPDWYKQQVQKHLKEALDQHFRLWFFDNAIHDDKYSVLDRSRLVSYLGALHQALIDVSAWVEKGIEPAPSTQYTIEKGQLTLPTEANARKGIQPVFELLAGGAKKVEIKAGEAVELTSVITLPDGTGEIIEASIYIADRQLVLNDMERNFPIKCELVYLNEAKSKARIKYQHVFEVAGEYFPVLNVRAQRTGCKEDKFTHIENLSRVCVIVL